MTLGRTVRDRWVLAAIVIGVAVRFIGLGAAPLWFDEVMSAEWVRLPWRDLFARCLADNHPPLYFTILKGVRDLLGDSPWALRLPSAIIGAAAVPFVAASAARLAGAPAARWAAWFAALSPFLVHHGQEARMYALVGTLAAANLLALAEFASGASRRLGAAFVITALALVGTHYYTVFYLGGCLLAACLARPRPVRDWLPAAMITSLVSLGAFAVAALVASHRAGGDYELGWFAFPGAFWSLVSGYTLMPDTFALHAQGSHAALPYVPIALAAAPALIACALLALGTLTWPGRLTLVLPVAVALFGPFAVRLVLGVAVNPRYFQATVPAILVLLAIGAAVRGAWTRVARVAGATTGLLLATGTALHLAEPGHGREDIRAATAWLEGHAPPGEPLLVTSREMAYLARFHWPARTIVDYPDPHRVIDASSADDVAAQLPWRDGRAYYVFGRAWVSDPQGALERDVRQRWASCGDFEARGIRIHCLDQTKADARPSAGHPPASGASR